MSRSNGFSWTLIPSEDPDWVVELLQQFKKVFFVLVAIAYHCVTETLMDLLQQWRPSGPPSRVIDLFGYVLQATINTYIRTRIPRKDTRFLEFIPADKVSSVARANDTDRQPLDWAIFKEEFQRAKDKVLGLSPVMICVLTLFCSGTTHAEIASILEISERQARSLKHKAIKKLRWLLEA